MHEEVNQAVLVWQDSFAAARVEVAQGKWDGYATDLLPYELSHVFEGVRSGTVLGQGFAPARHQLPDRGADGKLGPLSDEPPF